MPGRNYQPTTPYKYGFNGKENDREVTSTGSGTQDYGFRIYNPSLGKFLSVDPLTKSYPMLTPYQFASNTPIQAVDLDGLEADVKVIDHSINGEYSPMMDNPNEFRVYRAVSSQLYLSSGLEPGGVTYVHTSPNGIEAVSYTGKDEKTGEVRTVTASGIWLGILEVKAYEQLDMEDQFAAALEVYITHDGKKGGGYKSPKIKTNSPNVKRNPSTGDKAFISERAARREAFRKSKVSTTEANNYKKVKDPDNKEFNVLKTKDLNGKDVEIKEHPDGHEFKDNKTYEDPHYHGTSGEHYTYPKKNN